MASSAQKSGTVGGACGGHEILGIQGTEKFLSGKGCISHRERRQRVLVIDLVKVLYDDSPSIFKGKNQGIAIPGYGSFAGIELKGKVISFADFDGKSGGGRGTNEFEVCHNFLPILFSGRFLSALFLQKKHPKFAQVSRITKYFFNTSSLKFLGNDTLCHEDPPLND